MPRKTKTKAGNDAKAQIIRELIKNSAKIIRAFAKLLESIVDSRYHLAGTLLFTGQVPTRNL